MLCWHREFANRIYFLLLAEISSIIGSGEWILKIHLPLLFFRGQRAKVRACTGPWRLPRKLGKCAEHISHSFMSVKGCGQEENYGRNSSE